MSEETQKPPAYGTLAAIGMLGMCATGVLMFIGGAMITNAMVLALLGGIGFWILFLKLPEWFRDLIARMDMWADLMITGAVFWAYGLTATGIMSAAITDLFLAFALFANKIRYDLKKQGKLEA